jgi:hypothetical protein
MLTYQRDFATFVTAMNAGERVEVDCEMFDYFLDALPPVFLFRVVTLPDGEIVKAVFGFAEGANPIIVFWRDSKRFLAQQIKERG